MSEKEKGFTKESLDIYLRELAKEFRKLNGKTMSAEITLVGGSAILVNYGFRGMTTDVDAIIHASSAMKDAIRHIGDKYNLPYGWLNADFMRTKSYSTKLEQFSTYYRTFSNILTIRTISAEYLIAMKLRSGRKYKHDMADVIGILADHEKQGNPITLERIRFAVEELYGGWEELSEDSQKFIEEIFEQDNFEALYRTVANKERQLRSDLIDFEKTYPSALKESNLSSILERLSENRGK